MLSNVRASIQKSQWILQLESKRVIPTGTSRRIFPNFAPVYPPLGGEVVGLCSGACPPRGGESLFDLNDVQLHTPR